MSNSTKSTTVTKTTRSTSLTTKRRKPIQPKEPLAPLTVFEVIEKLNLKLVPPEENDNNISDIIGLKDNKEFFAQIVNRCKKGQKANDSIKYHPNLLFLGPCGAGKTTSAFAIAKELQYTTIVINTQSLVSTISDHESLDQIFDGIKLVIDTVGEAVVLFKEIHYINSFTNNMNVTISYKICDVIQSFDDCLFIASSSQHQNTFQGFFVDDGGFDTPVTFELPSHNERIELIKRFISQYPYDEEIDFDKLSRNFIDYTGGEIKKTLRTAYIQMQMKDEKKLTYKRIDSAISIEQYGKELKKLSDKEIRYTAYHEAGHVILGFYGWGPEYKLHKVEVKRRQKTLGITIGEEDEDKETYTKKDMEGRILLGFGGMIAEQIIMGTTTSGVTEDLATNTIIANTMIKNYGMDSDFGPVFIHEEVFDSGVLSDEADIKVQSLLKRLYNEGLQLMYEHKDKLIAISEALIEKEVLYKEEILELLKD